LWNNWNPQNNRGEKRSSGEVPTKKKKIGENEDASGFGPEWERDCVAKAGLWIEKIRSAIT